MVTASDPVRPARGSRVGVAVEVVSVLVSPAFFYALLRLRGTAPSPLPDPSMHTTFVVDPRDIFTRYSAAFAATDRMREGARVGFLVPARAAYLLFGAVGGFFTFRYVLALVAIVPLYLLLRRLYGRWAGYLAIAVVMSNPVFVTAWGTDYPDSAAISYLTGGICALVMPCRPGRRAWWLVVSAGLFTLAVWSHGAAVPLVAAALVAYGVVRVVRERAHLLWDAGVLLVTAVAVTGALAVSSRALLGQLNFITPTLAAARFLNTPSQVFLWHSSNWRWVLYDVYLLVPPAVLVAFAIVFARRPRQVGTAQLFFGLTGALGFGAAAFLQFVGTVWTLEYAFFSSVLWSVAVVLLALTLAELARPSLAPDVVRGRPRHSARTSGALAEVPLIAGQALSTVLVVAVALAYEADPHVPAMTFGSWGWVVAAIVVAVALAWRLNAVSAARRGIRHRTEELRRRVVPLAALVLVAGACLVLTVAPRAAHPPITGTVANDPAPAYARALGGSDTAYLDEYWVVTELPGFVGHAAYAGEQLLMWYPHDQLGALTSPIGVFHAGFDSLPGTFPALEGDAMGEIEHRRAAQILLMSVTGNGFAQAVHSLAQFEPHVAKRAVLADGEVRLHLWLVDLGSYLR